MKLEDFDEIPNKSQDIAMGNNASTVNENILKIKEIRKKLNAGKGWGIKKSNISI